MKILRIFGVVVGVHVFALMLIFANPGCSSPNKPGSSADDSVTQNAEESPVEIASTESVPEPSPISADSSYQPEQNNVPPVVRFSPTRPGTPAASVLEAQPVNDVTPATTYTVVPGDSLWTIARRNHLAVAELAAANNIKPGAIVRIGQRLIIPEKAVVGSSASVMEPSAPKAAVASTAPRAARESVRHVVRPGETLGGIARKYQVKVGEIATINNIADPAKIRPGMELTIPGWQAPRNASATPPVPAPATVAPETSAAEVPTLVIPPPDQESRDNEGVPENEPPIIRVDDNP